MPPSAGLPFGDPFGLQSPRLWSLWDMINFLVPHYMAMQRIVFQEISLAQANLMAEGADRALDGREKDRISQNLKYIVKKADDYGFEAVRDRLERIMGPSLL